MLAGVSEVYDFLSLEEFKSITTIFKFLDTLNVVVNYCRFCHHDKLLFGGSNHSCAMMMTLFTFIDQLCLFEVISNKIQFRKYDAYAFKVELAHT